MILVTISCQSFGSVSAMAAVNNNTDYIAQGKTTKVTPTKIVGKPIFIEDKLENITDYSIKRLKRNQNSNLLLIASLNVDNDRNRQDNHEANLQLIRIVSLSLFLLLLIPFGIYYPFFLLYKKLLTANKTNKRSDSLAEPEYKLLVEPYRPPNRKPDAISSHQTRATVSKLQIAFSPQANKLRQELARASAMVGISANEDMVKLMRRTIFSLTSQQYWTHASHSSISLPLREAKAKFELISFTERNKLSNKKLSLVNSDRQTERSHSRAHQSFYSYIVVTLVFHTSHDAPLFDRIRTKEQLIAELIKLSHMPKDYISQFELLWNPLYSDEYVTNEQMLTEYSDMVRLL